MARTSIAVIGLGGIGSTFAYHLARAGHDVTVIARPRSVRFSQLQREGGIVRTTGDRVEVSVADQLDENIPYDVVVVTMLAHHVDSVLPSLQRSVAGCVLFMFNTFDPERLQRAIGDRCAFGMPFVMATVDSEGKLDTKINPGQKTLHSDQRWVELFVNAGIPSLLEKHMQQWLLCHVPMCIAMESISTAGQRRGGGATWAESMVVARGLHAGFAVIKALGHPLYPSSKSVVNGCPTVLLACMLWTVSRITSFRELLATAVGECCALIDAMVAATEEHDVNVPAAAASILAMKPTDDKTR